MHTLGADTFNSAELAKASVADGPAHGTSLDTSQVGRGRNTSGTLDSTTNSVSAKQEVYNDTPTEEELKTLRRVSGKIPWIAWTIAFVELCERFSYYGTTVVFVNFIQRPLPRGSPTGAGHAGQSGALGRGQRMSTGLILFNQFWAYLMPLFGAYVADAHLGRFKTINIAIGIAITAHIILTASAAPSVIAKPSSAIAKCVSLLY